MTVGPGEEEAITATQHWLNRAVIGLNLCPFARAVQHKGQIRWVLSTADNVPMLLAELMTEMQKLSETHPDAVDTTLIVHPDLLQDFSDHNDFLDLAEGALQELGLEGVLQIASFHPQYRFADTAADDAANFTNRSPHPTLHLLREDSVARAVASVPDAALIYERNIGTLRAMGAEGWRRWMSTADPPQTEAAKPTGSNRA